MKNTIVYHKQFVIGPVGRRMTGSFAEHLNRCVCGGLHEPSHPTADASGFRDDVKQMIRDAGVSLMRYPGGNFVSAYHWQDGIGPREKRPHRFDMAWGAIETNQVGTDEFARYAREIGAELMLAVNLGTGTPEEAAQWVEYCNLPGGTYWSDLRKANGAAQPYDVKLWCVGNEMDGPWQVGYLSAEDYAKKYLHAAQMMKRVDPSIELIAAGSCSNEAAHPSFGHWDRILLELAYEQIDYLSIHRYYGYDVMQKLLYPRVDTLADVAAMATDFEQMLHTVICAIDYVKGIKQSHREVHLCVDELSILPRIGALPDGTVTNEFSLLDAVLYGGLLCTLINHANRVKIHCQSLVVNENGLFTTVPMGGIIPQSILYPFRDVALYGQGVALGSAGETPACETAHYGPHRYVRTACVYNEQEGMVTVFAANCSLSQRADISFSLQGFGQLVPVRHIVLEGDDPHARNTFETPEAVCPREASIAPRPGDTFTLSLEKHSWNVFRFKQKECMVNG